MALQCIDNGVALNHPRALPRRFKPLQVPAAAAPSEVQSEMESEMANPAVEAAAAALQQWRRRRGSVAAEEEEGIPFNPFANAAASVCGSGYELLKTVLMLPIALIRVTLFALTLLLGVALTKLAMVGAVDVARRPLPPWRRRLLWPIRFLARALLFFCGFHWIRIKGAPAPRSVAPLLVCNHVTFIDPVFIFFAHLPVIVTAEENLRYPLFGSIMRAMQAISIDRGQPSSRAAASAEIGRRAACNDWNHVMIFPEATTTNGKSLVKFKCGAFAPNLPVQPMVIRYPHVHCDPSWVALGPHIAMLLLRIMTQFHNFMEVEYLPYMEPERLLLKPSVVGSNAVIPARRYADRVRLAMARSLNVCVTEHSFEDLRLVLDAQRRRVNAVDGPGRAGDRTVDRGAAAVIEFAKFERLYGLTVEEAKGFYLKFRRLARCNSAEDVSYEELCAGLSLPSEAEEVRRVAELFLSADGCSSFSFRQYVNGLAFVSRLPGLPETMASAYQLCDRDGDGELSVEDVSCSLRELVPAMSQQQAERIWADMSGGAARVGRERFVDYLRLNPEYVALFLYCQARIQQQQRKQV